MDEKLTQAIGRRIRTYRKDARLTQAQLAARSGMTPETLSNVERGKPLPGLETVLALTAALSRTPNDLLGDDGWGPQIDPRRAQLEAEGLALLRGLPTINLAVAIRVLAALRGLRPNLQPGANFSSDLDASVKS